MHFTPINHETAIYGILPTVREDLRHKMLAVFLDLLIHANRKPGMFEGYEVDRGDVACSTRGIAERMMMPRQSVRSALKKLIQNKIILARKVTHQFQIITICNFDTYVIDGNKSNPQLTHNQPTTNHILKTTVEVVDRGDPAKRGSPSTTTPDLQATLKEKYGATWTANIEGYWQDGFAIGFPIDWPRLAAMAEEYSADAVNHEMHELYLAGQVADSNPCGLLLSCLKKALSRKNGKSKPAHPFQAAQAALDRHKKEAHLAAQKKAADLAEWKRSQEANGTPCAD